MSRPRPSKRLSEQQRMQNAMMTPASAPPTDGISSRAEVLAMALDRFHTAVAVYIDTGARDLVRIHGGHAQDVIAEVIRRLRGGHP